MAASVPLSVTLLTLLAAVLAWATFLEASRGREIAQWYVYGSTWFVSLLGLLGVNVLAAMLIRAPWSRDQIGFVITCAGVLVLLAGAIQTRVAGIEGQVTLGEAETADKVQLKNRSLITVQRLSGDRRVSSGFSFTPGAVDWPAGKSLDFGEEDGLGLRIVNFYRHARPRVDWVADETDYEGTALRLELSNQLGQTVAEDWLTASIYGGQAVIGPTKYDLLPIYVESMVEDFVHPPDDLGSAGVLSMHYQGKMYRFRIDDTKGERVALGDSGAAVEIVDYYPDGRPSPDGRSFVSRSIRPRNPVLELQVYLPGDDAPSRQLAFARSPLLSLDSVYGRVCPVKFWYHHAGLPQTPGAIFAQTPDGKLLCRTVTADSLAAPREVAVNEKVPIGGQFHVSVVKQVVRARREVSFQPVDPNDSRHSAAEAAVQLELSLGGQQRLLWLGRGEAEFGAQSILTGVGPVAVSFGYDEVPLGFSLELQEFQRRLNPGGKGDASLASCVKLTDTETGETTSGNISMNRPLSFGKYTLYQSSVQELPGEKEVSVLTVSCDPGRGLKYAGSLTICAGVFVMFLMRSSFFRGLPSRNRRRHQELGPESRIAPPADREEPQPVPRPLGWLRARSDQARKSL